MLRWTAGILSIVFAAWIMPLGAFIDTSKEKMACGGQRAICLCSHLAVQANPGAAGKVFAKGGASSHKEGGTSGFSSSFIEVSLAYQDHMMRRPYFLQLAFLYRLVLSKNLDPVPKV